jgi:hypothetical protein
LLFSSELLGQLHYIIDDAFGDMIDKEIERSMLSNTSIKKQKQQVNKSKLEHEGASAISQTITETREFTSFRSDVLRRLQSTLVNLVENFDEEFPIASSSTTLAVGSDTLLIDHGTIAGTSIALSEIIENRHSATGGGSSAYNVSYGSDSENSFTNGSTGRHVCLKRYICKNEIFIFRKVLCFLMIIIYVQLLIIYHQSNRKRFVFVH